MLPVHMSMQMHYAIILYFNRGRHYVETSGANAGVKPEIRKQTERVLSQGSAFDRKLSVGLPVTVTGFSRDELDQESGRGIKSLEEGRVYSADKVDAEMKRMFCI